MSPEHHLAVSGTDEGNFHIWDMRSGELVNKNDGQCQSSNVTLTSDHCSMDPTPHIQ